MLIIAPRHPDRGPQVAADLQALGFAVARRAAGEPLSATPPMWPTPWARWAPSMRWPTWW